MYFRKGRVLCVFILTVLICTNLFLPSFAFNNLEDIYNISSVSTIDIKLLPVTSDFPSVIIGISGSYGTKIYGENEAFEEAGIWLKKGEGGKYFCRYSTESISYPLYSEWEEIEPEITGEFIIKINSYSRYTNDWSGIDLNIFNDTELPTHVRIYNDDEDYPRVKIQAALGKTLINGQERSSWPDSYSVAVEKVDPDLDTFFAESGISSMAFSPDGEKAAYGYHPHRINILDRNSERIEKKFAYSNAYYTSRLAHPKSICYSPDGTFITYAFESDIVLRNVEDGSEIYTIQNAYYNTDGHGDMVNSIAISSDGNTMASGSDDNTVKLWNVQDGSILYTLEGHTGGIHSVDISSDGKIIASGSDDRTVKLWNGEDGSILYTLEGHTDKVTGAAISPDHGMVASGSADNTIKLWNIPDGTLVHTFEGHTAEVNSVAFSPDGQMLVSSSVDNTIKIWNTQDFSLVKSMKVHSGTHSAEFLPDNETVISTSSKGIATWKINSTDMGEIPPVVSIKYPADGTYYDNYFDNDTTLLQSLLTKELIPIVVDVQNIDNPTEARIYVDERLNTVLESTESDLSISGYWDNYNVDPGVYRLRCEVEDADGNIYTSEPVQIIVEGIVLEQKAALLKKGGAAETLRANIYLREGRSWTNIGWGNHDPNVIAITADGLSASITPAGSGEDAVRVNLIDGDDVISYDVALIVVEDLQIENILLNKTELKLSQNGDGAVLDARMINGSSAYDPENIYLLWSVEDESIVSIEANGTSAGIIPLIPGNTTVHVSTEDGTATASCAINVVSGPIVHKGYLAADENLNKVIHVDFSKGVKEGFGFSQITLKDSADNMIAVEKTITNKSLLLETNSNLTDGEQYTVHIPADAITDQADNPLVEDYAYRFTSVPPFIQNEGLGAYPTGAYDQFGIQPAMKNWTGQSRFNVGVGITEAWVFNPGEEIISPIVIDSDNVKYFTTDNNLYAVDSNGNPLWSYPVTRGTSPVIGGDRTIYVGSIDGKLYAINPDGTKKWEHDVSDGYSRILYSPEIGKDGSIYAGCSDFTLYAVNPDGTQKWAFAASFGEEIISSPITNVDGDIHIVTSENNVYSINMDGSLNWVRNLDEGTMNFNTMKIGPDGTVYVINRTNLIILDKNGNTKTRLDLNDIYEYEIPEIYNRMVLGKNGVLYVDTGMILHAIDEAGNIQWTYDTGKLSFIPFIGGDGTLYAAAEDGSLYGINQDGTLKSAGNLGSEINFMTLGMNGEIYAASVDGKLYCFDTNKDNIQPELMDTWPRKMGYYLESDNEIILTFSEDMKPGEDYAGILLEERDGEALPYTIVQADGKTFKIIPNESLEPWKEFYLTIPTKAVTDLSDNILDKDYRINFTAITITENIQGAGYQAGAYDQLADQPMTNNWSRQSRFVGSSEPKVKWFKAMEEVRSTPLLGRDGVVYVSAGDWNPTLYALNLDGSIIDTGTPPVDGELAAGMDGRILSGESAIAADGTRYAEGSNGFLCAYNPDGTEKWSLSIANDITHPPVIGGDGTIYAVTNESKLAAVNPDGTLKWSYQISSASYADPSYPTIGPDGTLYVHYKTYSSSNLAAINPDGTKKWDYYTDSNGSDLQSPAIGSDGTVYLYFRVYNGSKLAALDPDGTEKWVHEIIEYNTYKFFYPVIDANGTLYICNNKVLTAVNSDGSEKWAFNTENEYSDFYNNATGPAVIGSDGTIYLGTEKGLFALNNLNGDIALEVRSMEPENGIKHVPGNKEIEIVFNREIFGGPNFNGINLRNSTGESIMSAIDVDGCKLSIKPHNPLDSFIGYTVSIPAGAIADGDGHSMDAFTSTFTTRSAFRNGEGYFSGAYEQSAAQPTAFNWNRQSRFDGSKLLTENWVYQDYYGQVTGSPVIDQDGTIYVVSGQGDYQYLYYVNPDGKQIYSDSINEGVHPAIGADDRIYAGCDWYLRALDKEGNRVWQYNFAYPSTVTQITLGPNGVIYVTLDDHEIAAITADGLQQWSYSFEESTVSNPAVSSDGTLYIGTLGGNLHALNGDGTLQWTYAVGSPMEASPALGRDGTIYIGADDGNMYAVAPDGNLKWSFSTGGAVKSTAAVGTDGTVYFGSKDQKLYAVNPDGTLKWSYMAEGGIVSSPVVGANGVVYFGSEDTRLYAVDSDGAYISSFKTDRAITSSPAIGANGLIYVTSEDGKLYAIGEELKYFGKQEILGDVNGDTVVNLLDLSIAAQSYGKSDSDVDFNNDGIVDIYDLVRIVKQIQ